MDLVFYGDSRNDPLSTAGQIEHAKVVAQVATRSPDMVFESGDLVYDGMYAGYLSEFFPVVSSLAATVPFMAVPGNHDNNDPLSLDLGGTSVRQRQLRAAVSDAAGEPDGLDALLRLHLRQRHVHRARLRGADRQRRRRRAARLPRRSPGRGARRRHARSRVRLVPRLALLAGVAGCSRTATTPTSSASGCRSSTTRPTRSPPSSPGTTICTAA